MTGGRRRGTPIHAIEGLSWAQVARFLASSAFAAADAGKRSTALTSEHVTTP